MESIANGKAGCGEESEEAKVQDEHFTQPLIVGPEGPAHKSSLKRPALPENFRLGILTDMPSADTARSIA